jgi:D-alanine transaminase
VKDHGFDKRLGPAVGGITCADCAVVGITRAAVLRFAAEEQMEVEERPFTIDEAKAADEAFFTSASAFVMPVVEIDGQALGTGTPGPVTARLREIYLDEMRRAAV